MHWLRMACPAIQETVEGMAGQVDACVSPLNRHRNQDTGISRCEISENARSWFDSSTLHLVAECVACKTAVHSHLVGCRALGRANTGHFLLNAQLWAATLHVRAVVYF